MEVHFSHQLDEAVPYKGVSHSAMPKPFRSLLSLSPFYWAHFKFAALWYSNNLRVALHIQPAAAGW